MINNASYPYFYTDQNNKQCLLYSSYDIVQTKVYKLNIKNLEDGSVTVISTPDNHPVYGIVVSETNPHYRIDNENRIHLCYIAGFRRVPTAPVAYFLVTIISSDLSFTNIDLNSINIIKWTTVGSYDNNNLIYHAIYPEYNTGLATTPPMNPKNELVVYRLNDNIKINIHFTQFNIVEILNLQYIIAYDQYIVTVKTAANITKSYILNQNLEIINELTNNQSMSIGFASVLGENLAYTIYNFNNIPSIVFEEQ